MKTIMKMKRSMILLVVILAVFTQCKKDEEVVPDENLTPTFTTVTTELDVHNDLATWRYYSFEKQMLISVSNFGDTLGWDLGIHYENFRTNGGASGTGQGAVIDLGAVDFDGVSLSSIGSNSFTADDSITVIASTSMPPQMAKTPGCVLMEDMFESPAGPPPHTYTPNNHVYIIRTADGRHVKLLGTSFFNTLGEEGYFNFKFAFLD
ncbi:MAG: HmuY family protein [Bacteroidota bacterium]